jgi:hypothetical protein
MRLAKGKVKSGLQSKTAKVKQFFTRKGYRFHRILAIS